MSRNHTLDKVRNIGILAHIDAGKTTTTERILFYAGLTHKLGEVHEGTAVMDWMPQEQARGITITAAATSLRWRDVAINLIDTPGHVDFTVEVARSLRILDGAVFILDAKEGVEPQTEAVWRMANHYHVPRLVFVNKMDCIGADFNAALKTLAARFHCSPVPLTLPIGCEKDFQGVIDLLTMQAIYFEGAHGEALRFGDVPTALLTEAIAAREALVEAISDTDEALLAAYLEGTPPTVEALYTALRRATHQQKLVPVLCGSAYRNKGIQPLLDAIASLLPSPLDRGAVSGHWADQGLMRAADDTAPFSALVFKVQSDPYVGRLHYLRVYSGTLAAGHVAFNSSKGKRERMGKLLLMHANARTEVPLAATGDILAAVGLKFTTTGDTLCDQDHLIAFEAMDFPAPVISVAIEPKTPADLEKLHAALDRMAEEDPTFSAHTHPETGQLLISGMGELHLEVILDRIAKEHGVSVHSGKPQVAYQETVLRTAMASGHFSRTHGSHSLEARIDLEISPIERGAGHHFDLSALPADMKAQDRETLHQALLDALLSGPLGGYPVVDVALQVVSLTYTEDAMAEVALRGAAAQAVSEAIKKGQASLLEPVFSVTVHVPNAYVGDVMEDLQARRGMITALEAQHDTQIVKATAPLSRLFGYTTALRSKTQGRGTHTLLFSHYDVVGDAIKK